jgi:predicted enzyme related to lactoylglutathione lyase
MADSSHGTPVWVDLGTPDVATAVRFYEGLFGWQAEEPGEAEDTGGYRMLRKDGKLVAGIGPLQIDEQPTAWTTYIASDDADETASRAESVGGTIVVAPFDVFDAGRMAVLADPTGAAFGVWQPKEHHGAELFNEPGSVIWNELATRDSEAAAAFYGELFGWTTRDREMGSGVPYKYFFNGVRGIAGMIQMNERWPASIPPHWMPYFAVESAAQAAVRAGELGGGAGVPPTTIPPGQFAVLFDPARAHFSILEPTEESRRVMQTPEGVPAS